MAEYINRRHLLDAIENIDWYHCNRDGKLVSGAAFEHDAFIRYDTTESVIKAIPAADVVPVVRRKWKFEWISVEERLPEKSGHYLAAMNGETGEVYYGHESRRWLDPWEEWEDWTRFVTHWMPLPNPPKEETE